MTPRHITITHLGAETCVTGSCHLIRFQPDHGTRALLLHMLRDAISFSGRTDTQGRPPGFETKFS